MSKSNTPYLKQKRIGPTGPKLKFSTLAPLQKKIDEYFQITPKNEVTITGLAIHLGTSRQLLMDYENGENKATQDVCDAITMAKQLVALEYELDLRRKGRPGDIFALKNFGWRDNQGIDLTGETKVTQITYVWDGTENKDTVHPAGLSKGNS